VTTNPAAATQHRRSLHLVIACVALLIYVAIDGVALSTHPSMPDWGAHVDRHGVITWVDPNGPASDAGLRPGDHVLRLGGNANVPYVDVVRRRLLIVQRPGLARLLTERARPVFGPTLTGQALVVVGLLFLLVGGVVWSYGRGARTPRLLATLTTAGALTLLGYAWALDGQGWAMRLAFVAGSVLFPAAWAAFFLSFPRDRLMQPRWRRPFIMLLVGALVTLLAYALCLLVGLPYALVHALSAPVFPVGLLLGLAALFLRGRDENVQLRQQRHIVSFGATGAMLPVLLLSFAPFVAVGRPLVPYAVSALAVVVLPLALAYAIVRYDLMGLDVMVRRIVAAALGGFILIAATAVASVALKPRLGGLSLLPLVVAVLAGALSSGYVRGLSQTLAEHVLSPELVRSRHLLTDLQEVWQHGEEDLASIAARIEEAARDTTGVAWARLLARRRVPGALFHVPSVTPGDESAVHLVMPVLADALAQQAWGVARGENHNAAAAAIADEWRELCSGFDKAPAFLMPVRMRGEVIAVLAVGARADRAPLGGTDREALALLLSHAALAIDHARVRAELEEEGADAAALSSASMRLTSALDDRPALPRHIVSALGALRDVRGVTLLLYEPNGAPAVVAAQGASVAMEPPLNPDEATFTMGPVPSAWLPLMVGETAIGALCICWSDAHVIRDHDRRQLTVYANGASMALEHAHLYERARIQAEHDPVTDLYNHRAFHARLEAALAKAEAAGDSVGVLLIDVADFKLFNDTHGHQAGDQALRRVGEVLQACCRTSDAAARLGGDEFAVLLPDATADVAYSIAERISDLASLSELTSPAGQRLPVHLSIGAATFPDDADAANALLARADERMYTAKRAGVAIDGGGRLGDEREEGTGDRGRFGILEALVAMVDNRDRYTGEHSEQVAAYACAMAAELGLSHDTIGTLRTAGLLHDVGKIGVPDRILRKPDTLTSEECDIIARHVELSEVLLAVVSQDCDMMDAVRYHHERWDGTGYPRGVAGEDVPLLGRIMIVADAVSAMGMDRPYRKGLSWATIVREMDRNAGAQFDPALIPVALRALRGYLERADASGENTAPPPLSSTSPAA